MKPLFGGIEGGGTKCVCAVGSGPDDIQAETRFATTTPAETLEKAVNFFKQHEGLSALGAAFFGPLDPDRASPTYGRILPTPKPGWANADVVGRLRAEWDIPIGFDTDVNGAALAEWRWGAAQGEDPVIYLTVGTGIGGGALVNGQLLHGLIHPEMGHMLLPQDKAADPFSGVCPFHANCLEGLASGPAMEKRWGGKAETLPPDHPAWALEAHYLALGVMNLICHFSPQKIVLGGGVIQQTHLLPMIRAEVKTLLNGYVRSSKINQHMDDYIVAPGLGSRSGVLGALALAERAFHLV
ncbi:MAG TPA: ROK family protein [Anaerolineaceae bacterium]|nr:ROK family protein [Anaerolineaceae bacterium]HPN53243.1 ROK family protein [Anaerolineaceae bacterium]